MPSVPSGGANAMSMTESSSKIVFPAEEELRGKIPLWMKFYCYEYSSSTLGRAGAYNRSGGGKSVIGTVKELAQIFVPAPVNWTTSPIAVEIPDKVTETPASVEPPIIPVSKK